MERLQKEVLASIMETSKRKEAEAMRNGRPNSSAALRTRVDYVEVNLDRSIARLDEAIARRDARYDEAIKDLREFIARLESRYDSKFDQARKDFKEEMQQMESRHKEAMADSKDMVRENKASLEKAIAKAESSRNWVVGFVITVAVAIIGFILNYLGIIQT